MLKCMDDRGIQNTSIAQGLTAGSDTIGDPIRNCYATRVGSLKVTGDSTLANATVNGTLTSSGTTLNGTTTINGGANFNNSVNIADNPLTITGTGTLEVAGLATLGGATVTGAMNINTTGTAITTIGQSAGGTTRLNNAATTVAGTLEVAGLTTLANVSVT